MEENKKSIQCLSGTTLKLIAMASMFIDHIGVYLCYNTKIEWFNNVIFYYICRGIGRLAFPIFAFFIVEGILHTSSKWKYLLRLGIFAILSEIPYDFAHGYTGIEFSGQNVILTFFLAVAGLLIFDYFVKKECWWSYILAVASLAIFAVFSEILHTDYGYVGVGLIYILYVSSSQGLIFTCSMGALYQGLILNGIRYHWIQWYGIGAYIPLLMYNGKRGKGWKWLFYIFYPAHLVAFGILVRLLQ